MPDGIKLNAGDRLELYAVRHALGTGLEAKLGLRIPIDIYFQDPLVAASNPDLAFDENCLISWEPGFGDGPTSARFAVVDYDGHTESLAPPARWDGTDNTFRDPDGAVLDRTKADTAQFHSVNVWAVVQRALDFYEGGFGLGRRIPWAFDGNRLIVVPHAGLGENAYYDRESHSLQFYYFDRVGERIYTCLSTDITNHEFGHAVLDGIRPNYIESVHPETAAFHEFIGDLTAILISLRNTPFRHQLIAETNADLTKDSTLSRVAEQFGTHVQDKPYLRSARSQLKASQVANDQRPHYTSQVLTGAMFDLIIRLSQHYMRTRKRSVAEAFWNTIQRMQSMAIQPLDLLPPVDVTFRDYAMAVLRTDEIASPVDPDGYRGMMLDAFIDREILAAEDRSEFSVPRHVFDRLDLDVFHDVNRIASSPMDAYRFLDDNRRKLFIPASADVTIADISTAQKLTRQARRLPRQILLQYVWREDVLLEGARFGEFGGASTTMLCGATLALDQNGEMLSWARKPGSQLTGGGTAAAKEQAVGVARRSAFLDALARQIKAGRIGSAMGSEKGLLPKSVTPLTQRIVDGTVRFELSPHLGVHDDQDDAQGGRSWQISS
jgi:hypothetical protein